MIEKTLKSIVIKHNEHSENNLIVTILTNEGKMQIYAPGVRKIDSKNRNAIGILDLSNLDLLSSEKSNNLLFRLKKANLICKFPYDVNAIEFKETLLYFLEKSMSNSYLPFIQLYEQLLPFLNQNKNTKILIYLLYKLLECEGIKPKFDGCIECGSQTHLVDFKFHKGGFLCNLHAEEELGKDNLMSLYYLSISFEKFEKNTSFQTAKFILKMLIQYLHECI